MIIIDLKDKDIINSIKKISKYIYIYLEIFLFTFNNKCRMYYQIHCLLLNSCKFTTTQLEELIEKYYYRGINEIDILNIVIDNRDKLLLSPIL